MTSQKNVLIVDDNPADAHFFQRILRRLESQDFLIDIVADGEEALEKLKHRNADIVFVDYFLDKEIGTEWIRRFLGIHPSGQYVLLTGNGNEQAVAEAMRAGACDYISKNALSKDAVERCFRHLLTIREMEGQRQMLSKAVEHAAEAVYITDGSGCIQYVNPAFTKITGYTAEDAYGQKASILKSGRQEEEFYEAFWKTILGGEVWFGKITNRRKDGEHYIQELTVSPINGAGNKPVQFVAVARDITEQQILEMQFRQSQKMEAVGQLAGGVAHDFNNILQAIDGHTEIIQESCDENFMFHTNLELIRGAVERASSLVRQLLTFSRRQSVEMKTLYLPELIANLHKMIGRVIGENIQVYIDTEKLTHNILADSNQMTQLFLNLCVNARDAMPEGGELRMTASDFQQEEPAESFPKLPAGEWVWLQIADTGEGMSREIKELIFEPFFTTKKVGEGTGLGLATCYGIVKQHEGHIFVESERNEGSTFHIFLPVCVEEAEKVVRQEDGEAPSGSEMILVAEDDEMVRDLAEAFLEKAGYSVLTAKDGGEALQLFSDNQQNVSLAILDVIMPGKSGREVFDGIKRMKPELPVLFLTGYSSNVVEEVLKMDKILIMNKPFSRHEILRKVRQLLDAQRLEKARTV